jgi:CheY-like chemotaxis protein
VAFFVDGPGEVVDGKWLVDAVPAWRGMRKGVAQIGDAKTTVIEANDLLNKYLRLVNDISERSVAGDAVDHVAGSSPATAEDESVPVPPAHTTAQVLIVERSEALRNTLASILSEKQLKTKLVDQLDAAIDWLDGDAPSLIISEFRVPSMAAKVLVEKLKAEGKEIPVLVTTTHSGDNAELLVRKLGVAGYISKPLDSADVLTRVGGFLQGEQAKATKA